MVEVNGTRVAAVVGRAFRGLARLRRARAVHPRGRYFHATLAATHHCPDWLPLPHRATPVMVRFSRGAGLPERVPDILGLAIRLPQGGEDGPWDILLSSSGRGPLRWLPLPAAGWGRTRFSTIMSMGSAGDRDTLMAIPSAEIPDTLSDLPDSVPLRFTLARSDGHPIGHLTVLAEAHVAEIAFDPNRNRPEHVRLWPRWLAHLRDEAREASRSGRPDRT